MDLMISSNNSLIHWMMFWGGGREGGRERVDDVLGGRERKRVYITTFMFYLYIN